MRLFAIVLTAVLAANFVFGGTWDGQVYAPVTIHVISEKDGRPVVSARVWLLTSVDGAEYKASVRDSAGFAKANGPIERFGSRVFADGDGKATIWTPFEAGGDILADGTGTKYRTTYRSVQGIVIVEDRFHERYESELEALLPSEQKSGDLAPISITIRLKEKPNQSLEPTRFARGSS